MEHSAVAIAIAGKELAHPLPVCARCRGPAGVAGGVAIHVHLYRRMGATKPRLSPFEELFARRPGVGIGKHDFIEDIHPFAVNGLVQNRGWEVRS
jgi:hypothetical protein